MADPPAASIHNRYTVFNDSVALFSRTTSVGRCQHTDWDLCESTRLQELAEARERAAQMEKTMRWWSECTASWREKWAAVRDERNRAREETQSFRTALEEANVEMERVRSQKREVDAELARAKSALHRATCDNVANRMASMESTESVVMVDEECEARPAHFNVSTQTAGGQATLDPFDCLGLQQQRRVHSSPQLDHILEKGNQLEARCSQLEAELKSANAKIEELEIAKKAAQEEAEELRKGAEEGRRNKEVEKALTERDEARGEAETLRMEKEYLMQQLQALKRSAETAVSSSEESQDDV